MIQEIKKFRASDGSDHDTEYKAWKHELKAWLIVNGADNEAIAEKITKAIDDGRPDTLTALGAIVAGMVANAPPPAPKAVAPQAKIYPIPDFGVALVRCKGNCDHPPGYCTNDVDYQRWVKAKQLYEGSSPKGGAIPSFESLSDNQHQFWLNQAETT